MFGRRKDKGASDGEAIVQFWRWWADARHRIAAAISDRSVGSLATEISRRVKAIHKDLEWELSQGRQAEHALVVSPGGHAELRTVAARWHAAAPPADEVFEYFSSRQPDDSVFTSRIQIAGHELDLEALRFAFTVTDDAHDLDVAVFHPNLPNLPEQARMQLTFLALDWALGEEQVELWVGQVNYLLHNDNGQVSLHTFTELHAAVADMITKHAEPVYAMLGAEDKKGRPMMAMVQVPLRPVRWPRYDTHIAVTARYPAQPNGLPTDESLEQLRDLEDRIEAVLPPHGEVIAHETTNGTRTIHVYADGTTASGEAVSSVVKSFTPLNATTSVRYDPSFQGLAHLRP